MNSSSWSNEVDLNAAPHASMIRQHLTPSNCNTTTPSTNNPVYCIRASAIDDTGVMKSVTVNQLIEFLTLIETVFT